MSSTVTPVFLFSLPRSGSTLLQRVLMSHSRISSVAEPWFLLPLLYMLRKEGSVSEYSSAGCYEACQDLMGNMEGGPVAFQQRLGSFASSIYDAVAAKESVYFVDKTPRYYHIISDIAELFPQARFLFLFRNPADIYASILETWNGGSFRYLWNSKTDLDSGPALLAYGYRQLRDRSIAIRYEDLVKAPEKHVKQLLDYLDIDFEKSMLDSFNRQDTRGRMGDPSGAHRYSKVDSGSIGSWRTTFDNTFKKRVLYLYVKAISSDVLSIMGYNKSELLNDIKATPTRALISFKDIFYYYRSEIVLRSKANLFVGRETKWARRRYLS